MNNLALLLLCFSAGIILRITRRFPESTSSVLNGLVVYVSLPALTVLYVRRLEFAWDLLVPVSMAWLFFVLGFVALRAVSRALGLPRSTEGALIMTGALGNTSFVGLPMIEAFYGRDWLWVGMVADQAGSFMVLSTLGLITAVHYSSGRLSVAGMAGKIALFPPFLAMLAGVGLNGYPLPPLVESILERIGNMLVPLALISVGFALRLEGLSGLGAPLAVGLLFKLVLAPAILLFAYSFLMKASGPVLRVTIFEAAMPPMITGAIVAMDHGLDSRLSTLMVGVGIPLSFLSLPLWCEILHGF